MQTHRFIRIDELDTGKRFIRELMAGDAARVYKPEVLELLSRGQTVRIGDTLHCDLNAFLDVTRRLPDAMTRPPRSVTFGSAAPGRPTPQISVATDDDTLVDCVVNLAARRHGFPQLKRG